jgi:hypothetical protein
MPTNCTPRKARRPVKHADLADLIRRRKGTAPPPNGRADPAVAAGPPPAPGAAAPGPPAPPAPERRPTLLPGLPPPLGVVEARHLAAELGLPEPHAIGLGLFAVACVITPELAFNWLTERNGNNRNLYDAQAQRIRQDILQGRWQLTHQGVAFRKDGQLQDGQHRLWGIIEAGTPVPAMVVLNVTDEARLAIDSHVARKPQDVAALTGADVGRNDFSALRRAILGLDSSYHPWSNQEALAAAEQHREAVVWARRLYTARRNLMAAPLRAVLIRAWYHEDRDRLADFAHLVAHGTRKDGTVQPADSPAVLLRDWLLGASAGRKKGVSTRDAATQVDVYGKATRALLAYLRGEALTKLYAVTKEAWELPA